MGRRFAKSSPTCRKMKALIIIAMLAVTKGRRLQQINGLGNAFNSRSAFSSRGGAGKQESNAPDSETGAPLESPLDVLLNDPALKEQLVAMAGHMDVSALLIEKAPPSPLMRTSKVANGMFKLSIETISSADFSLPKAMEGMIVDQNFQKQAQAFAEEMQEHDSDSTDFHDKLEAAAAAVSSQQTSTMVSEKVTEVMTDPEFQHTSRQVGEMLASLMQDPEVLQHAKSIVTYLESVVDSQDLDVAQKVSEQVEAILGNTKFTTKASAIAYEMLEAETKDSLESAVDDKFVEELIALAENPTQELLEAMQAKGSIREVTQELKKAMGSRVDKAMEEDSEGVEPTHPSLLEEWSGQEDANKPHDVKRLLAALMLLVGQGKAFQVGGFAGRSLVAIASQPNNPPALGGWAPSFHTVEGKTHHRILMRDLGSEERAEEEIVPPTHVMFQQPKPDIVALTCAKAIRSILPSLRNALQRWGRGAKVEIKDGDGNVKKGFPVSVALLLSFAVWYLFYVPLLTLQLLIQVLSELISPNTHGA